MNAIKMITAQTIMAPALTVDEDVSLKQLFDILDKTKSTHIIVTNDGLLKGIISKEDILRRMLSLVAHSSGKVYGDLQLNTVKAKNIMTKAVVKVSTHDDWSKIVEIFRDFEFHCLPVVTEENVPVGIITPLHMLLQYTSR